MADDYVRKVSGAFFLRLRWVVKVMGMEELELLARKSQDWQCPRPFSMESSTGYWRRFVLPKVDLVTGRSEYRGALPKVLPPVGVPGGTTKVPAGHVPPTRPEG